MQRQESVIRHSQSVKESILPIALVKDALIVYENDLSVVICHRLILANSRISSIQSYPIQTANRFYYLELSWNGSLFWDRVLSRIGIAWMQIFRFVICVHQLTAALFEWDIRARLVIALCALLLYSFSLYCECHPVIVLSKWDVSLSVLLETQIDLDS